MGCFMYNINRRNVIDRAASLPGQAKITLTTILLLSSIYLQTLML